MSIIIKFNIARILKTPIFFNVDDINISSYYFIMKTLCTIFSPNITTSDSVGNETQTFKVQQQCMEVTYVRQHKLSRAASWSEHRQTITNYHITCESTTIAMMVQ